MRTRIARRRWGTRSLAASVLVGVVAGPAFCIPASGRALGQTAGPNPVASTGAVEPPPETLMIAASPPVEQPAAVETTLPSEPECERGRQTSVDPAYGWPVKPFHRQHPVRGYFGDPRVGPDDDGTIHRTFHFGVDVAAPHGTAVYATASGVAAGNSLHPDVVRIMAGNGVEFSYWHIAPAVRPASGWSPTRL